MTRNLARNPYDEVPYLSLPIPETHPDLLATTATLLGLEPPPIDGCRVLELGCAGGGNLIPLALAFPDSEFVGIEPSAAQVSEARVFIDALGLKNVRIEQRSLTEIDPSFGSFDYIIAHGVYAWVPAAVRDRLLEVCHQHLSPQGVAYVSYSTLPGWHLRGMAREILRYHTRDLPDLTERVEQSRGFLAFLSENVQDDDAARAALKGELELMQELPDTFILHDLLEEDHQAVYFHQFIAHAGQHRLQYLAEAEFGTMLAENLPPKVAETLRIMARDLIDYEQYLDFVYNRKLRKTLLCHAGAPIDRNLRAEAVSNLYVAAGLSCEEAPDLSRPVEFQAPGGQGLRVAHPLVAAALLELSERWPQAVAFPALVDAAQVRLEASGVESAVDAKSIQQLGATVLRSWASGLIELHTVPSPFSVEPGDRPVGSPLARLQASGGPFVTSLAHRLVELDPIAALVLPLLDGTRDRAALITVLEGWAADGTLHAEEGPPGRAQLEALLDQVLSGLAREALLMGGEPGDGVAHPSALPPGLRQ